MKNKNLYFSIIHTSTKLNNFFKRILTKYKITPAQLQILNILWQNNHLSSKYIQAETGLDSSTVTGIINRIIKSGFITKTINDLDKREVIISLTEKGEHFKAVGKPVLLEMEQILTREITEPSMNNFLSTLKQIDRSIHFFEKNS